MDDSPAFARVNDLARKIDLVQAQVDELFARFESALLLQKLDLAQNEDRIRRQDDGEEDLVG